MEIKILEAVLENGVLSNTRTTWTLPNYSLDISKVDNWGNPSLFKFVVDGVEVEANECYDGDTRYKIGYKTSHDVLTCELLKSSGACSIMSRIAELDTPIADGSTIQIFFSKESPYEVEKIERATIIFSNTDLLKIEYNSNNKDIKVILEQEEKEYFLEGTLEE